MFILRLKLHLCGLSDVSIVFIWKIKKYEVNIFCSVSTTHTHTHKDTPVWKLRQQEGSYLKSVRVTQAEIHRKAGSKQLIDEDSLCRTAPRLRMTLERLPPMIPVVHFHHKSEESCMHTHKLLIMCSSVPNLLFKMCDGQQFLFVREKRDGSPQVWHLSFRRQGNILYLCSVFLYSSARK